MAKKSAKKKFAGNRQSSESSRLSAANTPRPAKGKSITSKGLFSDSIWLRIVIVLAAAYLSFILFPRLQFAPANADNYAGWYGTAMGALMWWLLSRNFKKYSGVLAYVTAIGFLLVVIVNAALQFRWVDAAIAGTIVSFLVLPVGYIWMALLRQQWFGPSTAHTDHSAHQRLDDTPVQSLRHRTWMTTGLIALLIVGAVILFYRLGYYDFWEDEGLVINAAKGIQDNGLAYLQDGYNRSWLHTIMVTGAIQLFGESEWSARLPSALSGLVFIILAVYVFYKWWRTAWVALFIPLVCLLTDEFTILFRYTRMYAPMIPVFLAGIYCMYRFLVSAIESSAGKSRMRWFNFHIGYGVAAIGLLGIAVHLHPLAAIGLPAALVLIIWLAFTTRLKVYWYILGIGGGVVVLSLLLGYAGAGVFDVFPRAIKRMLRPDVPELAYYQYLFNNGLPANAVIMTLLAGVGVMVNPTVVRPVRLSVVYLMSIIVFALVFMVYIMADTGRDYRYIVHIVPIVVALSSFVLYKSAEACLPGRWIVFVLFIPLLYTALSFSHEYRELYVKHPWSPRYKIAYADIASRYKPGEAILYQNMKSYYLDPDSLAGDKAIKLGRRKEMTADQFKNTFLAQPSGWVVFDTHKSYHLDQEIIKFIIRHSEKIHGSGVDDTGVEVFYFNNDAPPIDE